MSGLLALSCKPNDDLNDAAAAADHLGDLAAAAANDNDLDYQAYSECPDDDVHVAPCAGLGAVDPSQGLAFLSAVLSSSSRAHAQPNPFLSAHFVYSPFLHDRLIASPGRQSPFYDALSSIKALPSVDASPALPSADASLSLPVLSASPVSNIVARQPQEVAGALRGIVRDVLGQDVSPTQPLMEVQNPWEATKAGQHNL